MNSEELWKKSGCALPIRAPNVTLDSFVVMPNHIHTIVVIVERGRGVSQYDPTASEHRLRSPSQTLGAMARGFKGTTTTRINAARNTPGERVWQRNYYEHIIRNDRDLDRIREYIAYNPLRWEIDQLHPNNPSKW
jgi:putative transposase